MKIGQPIVDQGGKNIKWEEVSSASGTGKAGVIINEVRTQPHIMHKNKLKTAKT